MPSLKDVKSGRKVRVVKVDGQGAMKKRIMDMGITVNTELTVRKVAPLGDPVEITVRGYELSLRKADIERIQVEEIAGA
jgi:ferrous iron transport protein A